MKLHWGGVFVLVGCNVVADHPGLLTDPDQDASSVPSQPTTDASIAGFLDPSDLVSTNGLIDIFSSEGFGNGSGALGRFVVNGTPRGCTYQILSNNCVQSTCPKKEGALVGAGTVTMTGGLIPVTMTPDVNNAYDISFVDGVTWWKSKMLLHIGASGDANGFAAFSVDLVAPDSSFNATFPVIDDKGNITVSWTVDSVDSNARTLVSAIDSLHEFESALTCVASPAWGHAILPAEIVNPYFATIATAQQAVQVTQYSWKVAGTGSQRTLVRLTEGESVFILHP
jgi:hypothetical protein